MPRWARSATRSATSTAATRNRRSFERSSRKRSLAALNGVRGAETGMTNQATIARQLLLYTLWADRVTIRALREVTPEDLTRDTGSSFPSLLKTAAHLLGAEKIWLSRFLGTALDPVPTENDFSELIPLVIAWEETAAGVEAFLAWLTDEQLETPLSWSSSRGESFTRPLWQPVAHLVNHSTYHRGQIVTMLRQMGYPVSGTDLVYYLQEPAG